MRRSITIAFGCTWLVLAIWALVYLPTLVPHGEGVRSAAETAGYNNRIAHIVAVLWLSGGVALTWAMARRNPEPARSFQVAWSPAVNAFILPVLVIGAVAVLYFPPALAWKGPVFEDGIHVNALHRFFAGDLPYRDFEFLYGPLMLFLPAWWQGLFSGEFSLLSYYSFVAILEAVTLLLVLYPIQKYIAGFWARLGAFFLMSQLYFNVMIGPNQNGLRKIVGVLILLAVANRPFHKSTWVLTGSVLGLFLSYSQEFAGATAVGIFVIYAALFLKMRRVEALAGLAAIGSISAIVWVGSAWFMLGNDASAYLLELRYLSGQFDAGEAAFAFYWTLAGLALFCLLLIAMMQGGKLLSHDWQEMPGPGELLLLGGLGYAALALKSGLSRADQWHLIPVISVIAFAVLLPLGTRFVSLARPVRMTGILLIAIMAFSFSFGQLRIARYTFYETVAAGWNDVLTDARVSCPQTFDPVQPAIICQNGQPHPELLETAVFLASEPYRGRQVFIHQPNIALAAKLGVHRSGHLTDGFIYGDERAEAARIFLEDNPDVLVVMGEDTYEVMRLGPDAEAPLPAFALLGMSNWRDLRGLVSSVHVRGVKSEYLIMQDRWRRIIGAHIADHYQPVFANEGFVVLERVL